MRGADEVVVARPKSGQPADSRVQYVSGAKKALFLLPSQWVDLSNRIDNPDD